MILIVELMWYAVMFTCLGKGCVVILDTKSMFDIMGFICLVKHCL